MTVIKTSPAMTERVLDWGSSKGDIRVKPEYDYKEKKAEYDYKEKKVKYDCKKKRPQV